MRPVVASLVPASPAPRGRPAAATLLAALLVAAPARADDALSRAQRAYADVDYGRCRDEAQRALKVPGSKVERVDAWRLAGLCAAALGEVEAAREAFKRMLAIDKDARLPDGLSPRFTSAFREAKGSITAGKALAVTVVAESVEGGTRTVRLQIADELELIQKIGWRGAGGSTGGPFRAAPLLELELPAGAAVTVFALDASGGEVAVIEFSPFREQPRPGAGPTDADEPAAAPFPWLLVGGIAGGVVVAGAIGVGLVAALAPPSAANVLVGVCFADTPCGGTSPAR